MKYKNHGGEKMKECKIIVLGFGSVGQGIAKAVQIQEEKFKNDLGIQIKIVAAADSSSSAIKQDGLDISTLLKVKEEKATDLAGAGHGDDGARGFGRRQGEAKIGVKDRE